MSYGLSNACILKTKQKTKQLYPCKINVYIDGLVQDCNYPIADALELLQSCTKPPICSLGKQGTVSDSIRFEGTSWNGNAYRITGRLCGESNGHRWIPIPKGCTVKLWFLCRGHEQKLLSKQSNCQRFATPWWLCDVIVMGLSPPTNRTLPFELRKQKCKAGEIVTIYGRL